MKDLHSKPTTGTHSPRLRALSILIAAEKRGKAEKRALLKARQNSGDLTPNERLLKAIFGEIK